MKDLLERLRARGLRLTAQRRVVAEALAGQHVHLSAEEVLERAASRLPEISRATVYNTLRELVELGEVAELTTDGRVRRFDPNASEPHHHLVCSRCGATLDVHPQGGGTLRLSPADRHGYALSGVDIVFRGLCPDCRGRSSRKDNARPPRR